MEENKRKKQQHKNVGIITKAVRKEKRKRENKLGRKLTKEETKKMSKEMATKLGVRTAIGVAAIGISIGAFMHKNDTKQLPAPQAIEISNEDASEVSKKEAFRNSLQLTPEQEMDNLETSEEVLNYIKEMYAEEYNQKNNETITAEDISLYKQSQDIILYKDTAQNGEDIIRRTTKSQSEELDATKLINDKVIVAEIQTQDGLKKEQITKYTDRYVPVYYPSVEVEEYSENSLCSIGDIVSKGIDKAIELKRAEVENEQKVDNAKTQENDDELEI